MPFLIIFAQILSVKVSSVRVQVILIAPRSRVIHRVIIGIASILENPYAVIDALENLKLHKWFSVYFDIVSDLISHFLTLSKQSLFKYSISIDI